MTTTSARGICRRRPGARGFTLVEVLVVVLLLAILVTLVVPFLGRGEERVLEQAGARLTLLTNLARNEAIMSSTTWQLHVDAPRGRYRFLRRGQNDFEIARLEPFREVVLSGNVALQRLTVNGDEVSEGLVHLFPTGAQDEFSVEFRTGRHTRAVTLGAIGDAELVAAASTETP